MFGSKAITLAPIAIAWTQIASGASRSRGSIALRRLNPRRQAAENVIGYPVKDFRMFRVVKTGLRNPGSGNPLVYVSTLPDHA
jgi:hypothetical protein